MVDPRSQRPRGNLGADAGAAVTAGTPAGGAPATPIARTLTDQPPLRYPVAFRVLGDCAVSTARLLCQRRLRLPEGLVRRRLRFADGTSAMVYRETVACRGAAQDPCVLVMEFRLRAVRGGGHAVFRAESLLNTPLFAGFPGFRSKLWLTHDELGRYRGVYQWDGPRQADHYARALRRVLALVSVPGSMHYIVLPGLDRDDFIRQTQAAGDAAWWRVTGFS